MSVAFLAIAVFLTFAVHEAGHALGGKLAGLGLTLFIVGPVCLRRGSDGRLRWGLNRKLSCANGLTSCLPRRVQGLRRAMLCSAAGGPVASIATGAAALAAWMLSDLPGLTFRLPGSFEGGLSLGIVTLGVASWGLGAWTLLPRRQETLASDGKRILRLWRANATADRYAAVMALGGCMMAGVRPRDWHPEVVAQAIARGDGSDMDLAGRHMAYEHALDLGDVAAAREHIRFLVDHLGSVPIDFRPLISVEAAYFEAAYDDDAASARRRLDGVWKRPVKTLGGTAPLCAEGALLLAEGDATSGVLRLRKAYAALADTHDPTSGFAMAEIRRLCRARGLPDPRGAVEG